MRPFMGIMPLRMSLSTPAASKAARPLVDNAKLMDFPLTCASKRISEGMKWKTKESYMNHFSLQSTSKKKLF